MKTRSLALAGAVALVLGACATVGLRRGGVNIDDTYIEIHPGTQISLNDQKALAKILSKYENKIYWVENISKEVTDTGDLKCVYVAQTFLNEVSEAESTGTSYSAIQIGARPYQGSKCENVHHTPSLHHTPNIHKLTPEDYRKCKALVTEVTPILQKYSRN